MSTRRSLWLLVLAVGLLVGSSCGGGSVERSGGCGTTPEAHLTCLREVGFAEVDGLEVASARKEQGMDTLVRFSLTGPPAAIDAALVAAGFTEPFADGPGTFASGGEVDLAAHDAVRSSDDVWKDAHDVPITRQVLRGGVRAQAGVERLVVQGFTT